MSLPAWGAVLILLALIAYAYLLASARVDDLERRLEDRELDRAVPVWSRQPLYDWNVGPDADALGDGNRRVVDQ